MYTQEERNILLGRVVEFVKSRAEFEGLLLIGSGAVGFSDIYSDIDLMAGCCGEEDIQPANQKLNEWFEETGAVYIDKRAWSNTVLGLSVYYENGLSLDISFMPTEELAIRSSCFRILFSKASRFEKQISAAMQLHATPRKNIVDDSIHHHFMFALRRCRVASLRGEYVYADIALSEARQLLLRIECVREGKKTHQFKAFNTLSLDFLNRLELTYPATRSCNSMQAAQQNLLALYLETVGKCDSLTFDDVQLKILNCFE